MVANVIWRFLELRGYVFFSASFSTPQVQGIAGACGADNALIRGNDTNFQPFFPLHMYSTWVAPCYLAAVASQQLPIEDPRSFANGAGDAFGHPSGAVERQVPRLSLSIPRVG